MFTGIISYLGEITQVKNSKAGRVFTISSAWQDFLLGESIAVNGVCLTVVNFKDNNFTVEVSPETLDKSQLGRLQAHDKVNLERSLKLNERLGGHWVLGHVDETLVVMETSWQGEYFQLTLAGVSEDNRGCVVTKGSITLNGVSLTINSVMGDKFMVLLIPETLKRTNLSTMVKGSLVNAEYDYLAKLVVNYLRNTM